MNKYYPLRYLFRRYEILQFIQPGNTFLEIGAGNLELSKTLLAYFDSGVAVDFSDNTLQQYQLLPSEIKQRLQLTMKEVSEFEQDTAYDCVIACEVMEHIAADAAFVKQLFQLIKPKGQVILSVPAHMKFWSIHDEIVGHLHRYSRAELETLFKKAGFSEITIVAYGYPFVNFLRFFRVLLAKKQMDTKRTLNTIEKTKASNQSEVPLFVKWLTFFVNPYTITPVAWLTRFFRHTDLSDGYLVFARRLPTA